MGSLGRILGKPFTETAARRNESWRQQWYLRVPILGIVLPRSWQPWEVDQLHLDVSENGGTPKWMVKIMENPIKMDDLGVPLFLETPIYVWGQCPGGEELPWWTLRGVFLETGKTTPRGLRNRSCPLVLAYLLLEQPTLGRNTRWAVQAGCERWGKVPVGNQQILDE